MKRWKDRLPPECVPFLLLIVVFSLLSFLNWNYEQKIIFPDHNPEVGYAGLKILGSAFGVALAAGAFINYFKRSESNNLFMSFLGGFIVICLFLAMVALIVMGPAAVTMMEQAAHMPR